MPLTANFLADFSSFINAARDATTSTDELVAAAGKVGASMDQAVAQAGRSLRSVGAGIAEFGRQAWSVLNSSQLKNFASDVTTFVSGYVSEFAKAESANARLEQSLKNAGLAAPEVAKLYSDMAKQIQDTTRFSSGEVKEAIALFTTIGKVGPDAMKETLDATANLAAFMQVDFNTAAGIMMKAASSDGEALGKLKTILGESYKPGMDFAAVIKAINEKFGGQALADLKTTAGQMEHLKNQMNDINEVIGERLAKNLEVVYGWFQKLPEGVQNFLLTIGTIASKLEPVLVSLGSLVLLLKGTGLGGALAAAGEAIGGFIGWLGPILLDALIAAAEGIAAFVAGLIGWPAVIIGAIVALAAGIYFYWDEIVAFLGKAVEKIKYFLTDVLPRAFTSVVETVKTWYYQMKYWLYDQFVGLVDLLVKEPDRISDAFKWMFNNVVGFSYVPDMVNGIASEFGRLDRVMVAPALAAVDDVNRAFAEGVDPLTLSPAALSAAGGTSGRGAGGPVTVTVNMSGMLSADDPQTRSMVSDLVSSAVMQGMRGGRLLGTA
jgi:hypothetical protein